LLSNDDIKFSLVIQNTQIVMNDLAGCWLYDVCIGVCESSNICYSSS